MKRGRVIPKSPIPHSKSFVVKELHAPYFDPTFHLHPEFQLSYVVKGEGTRFVGDTIRPFKANDLVLLGPNLPHVWRSHNPYFEKNSKLSTTVIVIYFYSHFLGESIDEKEEFEAIKHLFHRSRHGLEITGATQREVSRLMIGLLQLKGVDSIIQLLRIFDVLANADECHMITQTHSVVYNTEAETQRMNKVYSYVMKNFSKKINLDEVASVANMTNTSFSRYFKSRVNQTFSDFLKEIRVDYACQLLKEGDLNIDRIGYECGFQTLSNFNKQFKTVMGQQPHQYRNDYQKIVVDAYHH